VGLHKVYGDPIVRGGTIVPATEVRTGVGYGEGHRPERGEDGSGGVGVLERWGVNTLVR